MSESGSSARAWVGAAKRGGGWWLCVVLAAALLVACRPIPPENDALTTVDRSPIGLPVLNYQWKLAVADRMREPKPQEFAAAAVYGEQVFIGSSGGQFYALSARDGSVTWEVEIGAVSSRPVIDPSRGRIYIGTDDGYMLCLRASDGTEVWRYSSRGPIQQSPVLHDGGLYFSNEADQVYALDAETGKFRWQYRGETPEEYTLRGHAGVALAEGLVFTGFANGTMVALRQNTGSVAWLSSLSGDSERFVDADGTPAIHGNTVYITSSSGGAYALDRTTGLVRWRLPLEGAGGLAVERGRVYVAAANRGMHAVDAAGHTVWRQGTWGGGEPATPQISGSYVIYSLSEDGMFIADKRTGELYQYFDPGDGVSAPATVDSDRLYILSNRAILYALDLSNF